VSSLLQRAMDAARTCMEPSAREFTEDLAYFHLSVARNARRRTDRMVWGLEYIELDTAREKAIEGAKRQLRMLREAGHAIPDLLLSMARAEGFEP
jgi:hypothetical protein